MNYHKPSHQLIGKIATKYNKTSGTVLTDILNKESYLWEKYAKPHEIIRTYYMVATGYTVAKYKREKLLRGDL